MSCIHNIEHCSLCHDKSGELFEVWGEGWDNEYLPCKRCKGTGVIPKQFDEMDYLLSQLSEIDDMSELDELVERAMDKYTIKVGKRPITRKVIEHFIVLLKKRVPRGY